MDKREIEEYRERWHDRHVRIEGRKIVYTQPGGQTVPMKWGTLVEWAMLALHDMPDRVETYCRDNGFVLLAKEDYDKLKAKAKAKSNVKRKPPQRKAVRKKDS